MNAFIRAMVKIFSFGERWNLPFREATADNTKIYKNHIEVFLVNLKLVKYATISIFPKKMGHEKSMWRVN